MSKIKWFFFLPFFLVLLSVLPQVSFGAVATDYASYTVPATVNYTGFSGANGGDLYSDSSTLPVAYKESGALPATGTLNVVSWDSGIFDGLTPGSYHLVQVLSAQCQALSYASCSASNPGIPGVNEATFTINSVPVNMTDSILELLYVILALGIFYLGCIIGYKTTR